MLDSLPGIKLFDLSKKTAIVTGGSKGLGLAMAAGLASAGANLLIVNRNEKDGHIIADKIAKTYGVKALAFLRKTQPMPWLLLQWKHLVASIF